MFGLSFFEVVVLLIVGIVVVGPRQLPKMLRTLGMWITKLRRMAVDVRSQSGIDDVLRNEGIERDIQQLRSLLRRGNLLEALVESAATVEAAGRPVPTRADGTVAAQEDNHLAQLREYPPEGADAWDVRDDDDPYRASNDGTDVEQSSTQDRSSSQSASGEQGGAAS